jgi:hypothetical protein
MTLRWIALSTLLVSCGAPPAPVPAPAPTSSAPIVVVAPPERVPPPPPEAERAARIGVLLSLSGEDAPFGADTKEGIDLAAARYSKISLVYYDDRSSASEATNGALDLVAHETSSR